MSECVSVSECECSSSTGTNILRFFAAAMSMSADPMAIREPPEPERTRTAVPLGAFAIAALGSLTQVALRARAIVFGGVQTTRKEATVGWVPQPVAQRGVQASRRSSSCML